MIAALLWVLQLLLADCTLSLSLSFCAHLTIAYQSYLLFSQSMFSLASSLPPSLQELQSLANEAPKPGYLGHWELSRAVTTQHLLSVISVANTLMGMNNASFVMLSHLRKAKPKR